MKHFLAVSVTTYVFAMCVLLVWLTFTFSVAENSIIGSLIYLPHGVRVLCYVFFGYRALPALFLAEGTAYYLKNIQLVDMGEPAQMYLWYLTSSSSLLAVVFAVGLIKWSRTNTDFSLYKRINFANYRFLILVVLISAGFNAVMTNSLIDILNPGLNVDALRVLTYFIGDTIGSLIMLFYLMIVFRFLRSSKFIITN
jgi:hypothetical protein